ncbi:MAG: hypothetical protein HY347_04600 [candidate division NC10 bacterium]|nr:hypothetical protein [candidate division NC10 bacterium]
MSKSLPRLMFLTMLVVLLAFGIMDVLAQQVKPTGVTKIITLVGGMVTTDHLEINRGDTVVWASIDQPAMVYFAEGTPVKLACVAPTRFYLNEEGAYTTGVIPQGGTASLCFIEPGTFDYAVFFRGGIEAGGRIAPRPSVPAGRVVVK